MRTSRIVISFFFLIFAVPILIFSNEEPKTIDVLPSVKLMIEMGKEIFLIYTPKPGEGYLTISEKFTAGDASWKELKEINGDPVVITGKEYRLPYGLLRDEYKYLAIVTLYPEDRFDRQFWFHYPSKCRLDTYGEGLWQISERFSGTGEHFQELMEINKLSDPVPPSGSEIRIPESILLPVFSLPPASDDPDLSFIRDPGGDFAGYRLKKGETIYTSVVIHFTGMTEVDDVNKLAALIARRSGIHDAKNIPVGQLIKIPMEFLLPEYLPKSDPRRIAVELENYETEKYAKRSVAKKLEGIYVVLDAGHGGVDLGAVRHGVWEHDYVYDIMCRIKRKLESDTAATVLPLIEDEKTHFAVIDAKKLPRNKEGHILTDPPFIARMNNDTHTAVNLRWYLANSIQRKLLAQGTDEERIVFASLHADSLHPAFRGAMLYYAGHRLVSDRYGNGGSPSYQRFREVREMPMVVQSDEEKKRSEGLSKAFARKIVSSFKQEGLPIHDDMPMRNRILRHHQEWVPAVLKGNEICTKILLEVVNLNNPDDANLIRDPAFREKIASAFVHALISYYGES